MSSLYLGIDGLELMTLARVRISGNQFQWLHQTEREN